MANRRTLDASQVVTMAVAALFFAVCTWTSYARWANFEYRTFDLAYYVQAIWQLIHGRFRVSVEPVPLLGNHVEPIIFSFAPLFFLFRHPMLFIVVQNAALASMGPLGYDIAKRLGFDRKESCLLGALLLITPAASYIALHEFHPEALTAPLLLLMFQARLVNSVGRHWLWFIAVLSCKENMALLLAAYCAVQWIAEWKRGFAELRKWYVWPMAVAIVWFILCTQVITPALNPGNIDYLALYDRLGSSPADILRKSITQPQLVARALAHSLIRGNLLWALLCPFLFLPLLKPRWLIIATPVLLQHLLSWRSSEWMIFFHYAAPLLPLFWIALVESIAALQRRKWLTASTGPGLLWILVAASVIAQAWLGPLASIGATAADWFAGQSDRARKNAFTAQIPSQASVVAPFPYLTHLAMREKLYSLHYILKGLKTLSRASYEPPAPTDFVLIDYLDSSTFDAGAGYYHPTMKTVDGRIIPSSDRLLNDFLKRSRWRADSRDELTLLKQIVDATSASRGGVGSPEPERVPGDAGAPPSILSAKNIAEIATHTHLVAIEKSSNVFSKGVPLEVRLHWNFDGERDVFPWMLLKFTNQQTGRAIVITKGLCAPEVTARDYIETWRVTEAHNLPVADYSVEALFTDNSKRAWFEATGGGEMESTLLAPPILLGPIKIERAEPAGKP